MGTTHLGVPAPPDGPWWVVLPLELPSGTSLAHQVSSGQEKNLQKVSLRLDSVWYGFPALEKTSKNTTTDTQHYVNRLVPKNDIKLL